LLLVEQADIDALDHRDGDVEIARLRDHVAPVGVSKEVVVEEHDPPLFAALAEPVAAPDRRERAGRDHLALLARYHAELASEPAPALREADGRLVVRVAAVVRRHRRDFHWQVGAAHLDAALEVPPGPAELDVRVDPPHLLGERPRALEDERSVHAIPDRISEPGMQVARRRDQVAELDVIALRHVIGVDLHQREVWVSTLLTTIELEQEHVRHRDYSERLSAADTSPLLSSDSAWNCSTV
jgi:hypothetical protein